MTHHLTKPNHLNSIASPQQNIQATQFKNQFGFIKLSQWMLLLISNAVCLTFVTFAYVLINWTAR